MMLLRMIWGELVGLFVDDGALALQVVVLIAAVTVAVKLLGLAPLLAAALVLVGCLAILGFSLQRAKAK